MITYPDTTAAVSLTAGIQSVLEAFKADSGLRLQLYPGRPVHLSPPSIWQDARRDTISFRGPRASGFMGHTMNTQLVALHGRFDAADTLAQRDAFVDAFLSFLRAGRDLGLAGPNSNTESVIIDDEPNYVANWVPPDEQVPYYATLITLEVSIED